jgi:hypothetical protein
MAKSLPGELVSRTCSVARVCEPPVTITGRAYVAFAIPPGSQVRQLKLFDSAGHVFAITTSVPLPK